MKNKVKDKIFTIFSIEISSDNEKNKNKKKNKKKNNENDEKKNNNKNVKKINVFFIVKKLFNQKNYNIINFKKRINDVKKDYINFSNILTFEKNKIILSANKKDVNKIFILITKTYIFV